MLKNSPDIIWVTLLARWLTSCQWWWCMEGQGLSQRSGWNCPFQGFVQQCGQGTLSSREGAAAWMLWWRLWARWRITLPSMQVMEKLRILLNIFTYYIYVCIWIYIYVCIWMNEWHYEQREMNILPFLFFWTLRWCKKILNIGLHKESNSIG